MIKQFRERLLPVCPSLLKSYHSLDSYNNVSQSNKTEIPQPHLLSLAKRSFVRRTREQ